LLNRITERIREWHNGCWK